MPLESLNEDTRADITDAVRLVAVLDEITACLDQLISDISAINSELERINGG